MFNICISPIVDVITALKFIINLYIVSTLCLALATNDDMVTWWIINKNNYVSCLIFFFVFDAVKNIHFATTKKRNCKISLIYIFNFASYALPLLFTSTLPNWIIKCAFNTSCCGANYFYFFRCFNFTQQLQQQQQW